MRDIRKYEVFQLADQLVLDVYRVTAKFPKAEMFGLTGQMRRAAASIPMNLAEGAARAGAKEFAQFVNIAIGSCEEVRYQLHLAEALGYLPKDEQQRLDQKYESVKRMLAKLFGPLAVSRKPMADVLGWDVVNKTRLSETFRQVIGSYACLQSPLYGGRVCARLLKHSRDAQIVRCQQELVA